MDRLWSLGCLYACATLHDGYLRTTRGHWTEYEAKYGVLVGRLIRNEPSRAKYGVRSTYLGTNRETPYAFDFLFWA